MTYLPFARKYRPQTFEELIGQPHVTETLMRALKSQRVAQAYLFAGQRGVGKTSAARILAKCLNCERGPSAKPCNTCANCTQITAGNNLDVSEIDGASNRGIDEIRSLRDTVPYAPTTGRFHVYIIDEVHMLTMEAFNALLKTLEEPPAHVKFIFATTVAAKVPLTIMSRCQRFDFRRLETSVIVSALKEVVRAEKLRIEEPAIYAVARAAEGSLRDAEVVLEQLASFVDGEIREDDVTGLLGTVDFEALSAWTEAILNREAPQALTVLTKQLERGREALQLLTGLLRHMRNLLVLCSIRKGSSEARTITQLIDEPSDRIVRLREQASRTSAEELLMFLQILSNAYELIRRSPMAQTILELVVIKLATREQWQSLEQISQRLEQLHTGGPAGGSTEAREVPDVLHEQNSQPEVKPAQSSVSPQEGAVEFTKAVVPEEIIAKWPVFLEQLGAQKMSLAAYLTDSKPLGFEDRTLTVGLPGFALHQEVLTALESQRLIEQILGELCNARISVKYVTLPEAPQGASDSISAQEPSPPIVQDIVKLFNATIVDRPPQTT